MRLRWKILIAFGVFIVLMAASLTITMRVQPERGVDGYKKLLRDKGEKLELSEVVPRIAPEDNSADAVQDAFRMLRSADDTAVDAMEMVAPGRALAAWQQPDVRGWNFTNSWPEFSAVVAANRPATEQLRQVLERRCLFFPFAFESKNLSTMLPNFMSMRQSVRQLEAAAVLDLHNGNCGAAATNIVVSLAMVQKNEMEGLDISHLIRLGMTSTAIAATWELLQATNLTDAELAAIQNGWQRLNFLKDAENSLIVERAWSLAEIQQSRDSHQGFKDNILPMVPSGGSGSDWSDIIDDFTKGPRLAIGEAMWRSSWSYSDELRTLKADQIIIDAFRTMQTNQSQFYKGDYDAMSTRLASAGITNNSNALYEFLRIPDWSEVFGAGLTGLSRKTIQTETASRVVITAIALKRFHLKHGHWPEKLGDLAPDFISSVPIDPYDGKPLKYRPNEDGTFLLYSVGEDGTDDGGDVTPVKSSASGTPSWYWLRTRDWVWPQPATPAEVQYFYEHPPK